MFSSCMLIAVSYILGIYFADGIEMSTAFFLCAASLCIGLLRIVLKKRFGKMLILLTLAFFFGVLRYGSCCENALIRRFPDKYVTVSGTIMSPETVSEGTYKNRYTLKLDTLSYLGTTYKTKNRIILNTKEAFEFGDIVCASGFLSEIDGISNEYEYDYSAYYKSSAIYARLVAREAKKTGKNFAMTPEFISGMLRERVSDAISDRYTGSLAAFLKAITVGDKSGFDAEYRTRLIKTGIYRTLYVPFVHVSIILLLAGLLVRNKKNRSILIIILLIVYSLFNSTAPTALKACAVVGILLFKKEVFGFANKADTLSTVVLIMTIADPLLCFNMGFVMSVASTVLVYLSFAPINKRVSAFFSKKKPRHKRICPVISVWIILTIGTLPLTAYFYNSISVYAALFTSLLSPLMLAASVITLVTRFCFRSFGAMPIAASAAELFLTLVEHLPTLVEKLPFYYLTLRTPTLREIIVFYLIWWIFLRVLSSDLRTNKTAVIAVAALALAVSSFDSFSFNTLSINFVNVGQGDGAVLHTAAGETVLIDGGGSTDYQTSYNVGERVFLPYLISHGFTDIDVAIVSHCHKDHVEGIIAAAENLKINTIVMPDAEADNKYRLRLEELSRERGFAIEYLSAGDKIDFKSGLEIEFLAPDKAQLSTGDLNDSSLVARVGYGDFCALFTGDSNDPINEHYPKDIDLLKVAHHGSDTGSSEEYVSYVSPEYAVISVGKGNSYGLPDREVIESFAREGSQLLRTDKLGDIRFKVRKDGKIKYNTLKGG